MPRFIEKMENCTYSTALHTHTHPLWAQTVGKILEHEPATQGSEQLQQMLIQCEQTTAVSAWTIHAHEPQTLVINTHKHRKKSGRIKSLKWMGSDEELERHTGANLTLSVTLLIFMRIYSCINFVTKI